LSKVIEVPSPFPWAKAYKLNKCNILLGLMDGMWHLTISHDDRFPTLKEIDEARKQLIPDHITMGILFHAKGEEVPMPENTVSLHQIITVSGNREYQN
jgi:hypothetical protein